jgi:hypothetical protein
MKSSLKPKVRYVILRDDDTNALTPVECLERLYRPFLALGLPVNLATIPKVRTDVVGPNGVGEGYLLGRDEPRELALPIGSNKALVSYLLENPGYRIVQHGYHHSLFEFDCERPGNISHRLDQGTRLLEEAGFPKPKTFVAPYDRLSRTSLREVVKRFRVLSTGWFEWRRLPISWLPRYALKKCFRRLHWRVRETFLLSHPGCLLSYQRPCATMLGEVKKSVASSHLTVLVTHWWEYFRNGKANDSFIQILHDTGAWLADQPDIRVISFDDLADRTVAPA